MSITSLQKTISETTATILVVDDEPANIQLMHRLLGHIYRVLMATNSEQAIQVCKKNLPDLILLDVMMPIVDGLETCRLIKQDEDTADIPVIFVTSLIHDEGIDACWEAGAVDFIQKPIHPSTLLHRVNAHITLKKQKDLLKSIAYVDGLTLLYNRRFFDEELQKQFALSKRNNSPLSLLLVDVDYFKRYNDSLGHLVGDNALHQIAQQLKDSCRRPTDTVARYGGEEFAIILPDTDTQGAIKIAVNIQTAMKALALDHPDSIEPYVTLSIGIAASEQKDTTTLIKIADQQLYLAKDQGRNRYSIDIQPTA